MKSALVAILFAYPLSAFAATDVAGTYGLHLYFNEKEFVDVLTVAHGQGNSLEGKMDVPNDFVGNIENVQLVGDTLSFDLPVPKNSSRPQDLMFHYEGKFFSAETKQELTGFVTLKGEKDFVASFVAFRRK